MTILLSCKIPEMGYEPTNVNTWSLFMDFKTNFFFIVVGFAFMAFKSNLHKASDKLYNQTKSERTYV